MGFFGIRFRLPRVEFCAAVKKISGTLLTFIAGLKYLPRTSALPPSRSRQKHIAYRHAFVATGILRRPPAAAQAVVAQSV